MIRPWLFLLILPLLAPPAHGQPKPAPPPAISGLNISPDQARAALDTLNDPKKRSAFAATLEALLKNQPPAQIEPPPPDPPPAAAAKDQATTVEGIVIPLAPDSLGAQVLLTASSFVNAISDDIVRAMHAIESLPLLWGWAVVMLTNPLGQHLLLDSGWRLLAALVLAVGAEIGLRFLVRPSMNRLLARGQRSLVPATPLEDPLARAELGEVEGPARRVPIENLRRRIRLGLARFALQLVPTLGLIVIGHAVAGSSLGGQSVSQLVILAVIDAIAAIRILLAITTLLFMPDPPGFQLFNIRPAVGHYLIGWARRLILISVFGYIIGEVGLLLGLSNPAHDAVQMAVGLVIRICLAVMIIQRRRRVRVWLSAAPEATGLAARLRNRLAHYWAAIALFFLAVSWLNWVLHAPDAISRSVWYCAVTGAVLVGAAVSRLAVNGLIGQLRAQGQDLPGHSVRARLNAYHAPITVASGLFINALALLGLLQLYGLGGLTWLLTSEVGHRIASGVGTIVVTIGVAFAVWEVVNIAIQRHLETLRKEAQAARSARLRTLLPLIRTALSISIVVVAGLMVLSEIGVNIAPLLAGAGIVGVAIGFGSQKLVQDVITGVFLLLENAMQVGDVVRVGDQSGLIESLSVRTIRLRTENGSVVVMPFSAVTTVINMTRDFSRAVIEVNVSTSENVERVLDAMRAIVREMREEDAWREIILDDMEVWGLDKFTDSALLIKCRIMCTPFGRWPVGREFNLRMKQRFEELGIEMPYPHLKLVLDGPVALPSGTTLSVAGE